MISRAVGEEKAPRFPHKMCSRERYRLSSNRNNDTFLASPQGMALLALSERRLVYLSVDNIEISKMTSDKEMELSTSPWSISQLEHGLWLRTYDERGD